MTATASLTRLQTLLPHLFEPVQRFGQPYLRFQLTAEISALMGMDAVHEALLVSSQHLTPIPNMPSSSLGVMHSRDHVFFVVDLAQLLQLSGTLGNRHQYTVIVMQTGGQGIKENGILLGLAVNSIQGTTRLMPEDLVSPEGHFPESLTPCLQGCVYRASEALMVLDPEGIYPYLNQGNRGLQGRPNLDFPSLST